jgi:Bifunctional DNA primase/polymerase, N-terminal/Primase C terminal 2 (PriCT-2)
MTSDQTNTRDTPLVEFALDYAAHEIPVFPCNRKDKAPLVRTGFKAATTDEEKIREWWDQWPNAMIGIPTGPLSGIDALDIDVQPEEGIDGYDALPQWEELSPVIVRTPSGGAHLWFRSEGKVRNSTDRIAPGIDTRGEGGYIIAPHSINSLGGRYDFLHGDDEYLADLSQLPPFPPDLLAELGRKHEGLGGVDSQADPEKVAGAMQVIPNPDLGWDEWKRFGMAIWRATGGSEEGFDIFNEWSQKSNKYDAAKESYIQSHYSLRDSDGRRYQWAILPLAALDLVSNTHLEASTRPPGRVWTMLPDKMEELYRAGRIIFTSGGTPRRQRYLDEMPGVPLQDIWTDINPVNSQALEATDYATTKTGISA